MKCCIGIYFTVFKFYSTMGWPQGRISHQKLSRSCDRNFHWHFYTDQDIAISPKKPCRTNLWDSKRLRMSKSDKNDKNFKGVYFRKAKNTRYNCHGNTNFSQDCPPLIKIIFKVPLSRYTCICISLSSPPTIQSKTTFHKANTRKCMYFL